MSVREAVTRRSLEVVQPTEQLIRLWWNRMRMELGFDSKALRLVTVEVRKKPNEWAATHWPTPGGGPHLTFYDGPLSFKGFLTILVHELIHAILTYEDRHCEDLHAAAFMEYRSVLKDRFGLPLDDSYGPEEMLPKRKGA